MTTKLHYHNRFTAGLITRLQCKLPKLKLPLLCDAPAGTHTHTHGLVRYDICVLWTYFGVLFLRCSTRLLLSTNLARQPHKPRTRPYINLHGYSKDASKHGPHRSLHKRKPCKPAQVQNLSSRTLGAGRLPCSFICMHVQYIES